MVVLTMSICSLVNPLSFSRVWLALASSSLLYDAHYYGTVYKVRLDRCGTVGIQRTNLHDHATEVIIDSGCIFILSTVLDICGSRDEVVACQPHLPFTNLTLLCASFRRGARTSIKPRSMSQTSI
ncbi:uncharacterized protein F5891DRAFT_673868 [Suillus fuscotomentosus]|uniref:Uncharacterized protein n=1 Tax=Suillus fuscotomentosus TaxID=1912939 RepID=A0AAD4DWI2_9AGAM|nr:uncharacterized protein F5891DRAFT_673868 [Suillus fuscotomentosus]KAG1895297.1 hypothetical protein F5891DRAFT_673868 [Suillus fuscotomentosus]